MEKFKEKAMEYLEIEIERMYHNATLSGKLKTESDYESDRYDGEMSICIEMALEDLSLEFEDLVKELGPIYSYGRGGRTLAFNNLTNHRGLKPASELSEYAHLVERLREFNDRVIQWCKTEPDDCLRYVREEYAEELAKNKGKKRKTRTVVSYE